MQNDSIDRLVTDFSLNIHEYPGRNLNIKVSEEVRKLAKKTGLFLVLNVTIFLTLIELTVLVYDIKTIKFLMKTSRLQCFKIKITM